jgi:hypothetical protein
MQIEIPEKKTGLGQNILKIVGFLALFAIGCTTGFWLAKSLVSEDVSSEFPAPYKLFSIPIVIVILFLCIAIHEIGHLTAGILSGFTFSMFMVGPFRFEKEGNKIRFKWSKGLGFFGGLASCIPKNTDRLMRKFIVMVAGGPLMSLLTAIVALLVIRFYIPENLESTLQGFLISVTVQAFLWISLGVFIIACVPVKSAGFYTDGARIINLLRGGNLAKLDTTLMITLTHSAMGTRPSELDIVALREAAELPITSVFKVYADLYLYYSELDRDNLPQAELYINRAVENRSLLPRFYEGFILLEKAFLVGLMQQDTSLAQQVLEQVKSNNFVPVHIKNRVEAVVLLADNKTEQAKEKALEALRHVDKALDKGVAIWEREWLESVCNVE